MVYPSLVFDTKRMKIGIVVGFHFVGGHKGDHGFAIIVYSDDIQSSVSLGDVMSLVDLGRHHDHYEEPEKRTWAARAGNCADAHVSASHV